MAAAAITPATVKLVRFILCVSQSIFDRTDCGGQTRRRTGRKQGILTLLVFAAPEFSHTPFRFGTCRGECCGYGFEMNKIGSPLALLAIALTGCTSTPPLPETLSVPSEYTLVWSDEFDQDGLPDATRWAYDTHRNADGWYNEELQYYSAARAENARIEDGHLIIEARQETTPIETFPTWRQWNQKI